MTFQTLIAIFHFDSLAMLLSLLIGFIGLAVLSFSGRYLQGDSRLSAFRLQLVLLMAALIVMVSADNLALLLGAWTVSNGLLVRLMIHKRQWAQALASGRLAALNFGLGTLLIAIGFWMLYRATGTASIQLVNASSINPSITVALGLIMLGAMTQSALWPFHKWLLSSLNSPTPVSALMHAGLVNGGGFLLVRFAPLLAQTPTLLTALFVAGMASAVLGIFWKLLQTDVKRMLACSTMGQMGFMMAQIGLGLFPAAVAHLCWHGVFKSYLFLSSGAAAQEKRLDLSYPPKPQAFVLALVCGLGGAAAFGAVTGSLNGLADSRLVLMALALIASTQFALTVLGASPVRNLPVGFVATAIGGALYGGSVMLAETWLDSMNLMQPQPLNAYHFAGIAVLAAGWLAMLFVRPGMFLTNWNRLYVMALNASQPHKATVTTSRMDYRF